jgi:penicillin-binding protein 2
MDSKGNTLKEYEPEIINQMTDVASYIWEDLREGMYGVVQTHTQFDGLGVDVAGKTGTAQQDNYHPDHGLFIGYAPVNDPEYAVAIRIANGYTSGNACLIANDIFKYIYNLDDKESIVTGHASSDVSDTSND